MGVPKTAVVFVGHDATRTGAPILGLTFLRWLTATHRPNLRVVLLAPGPLVDAHRSLAPTTVAPTPGGLRLVAARVGAGRWSGGPPVPEGPDPDLVIANTLASLPAACRLEAPRLVCWVHELDGVAERLMDPAQRRELLPQVSHFVAAGQRVSSMLIDRWHVAPERVSTVDPFASPPQQAPTGRVSAGRVRPTILGSGSLVPRKGADAFVAVLASMAASRPLPEAAWVGGDPGSAFSALLRTDISSAGIGDQVELAGEVPTLDPWWPASGLLLHTPREDPFPLVVIEAGQRGIPVVTWDSGGAADLVRRAGSPELVAAAGDLLGVADRVADLLDHPARAAEAARLLQQSTSVLTPEHQAPAVWAACIGSDS